MPGTEGLELFTESGGVAIMLIALWGLIWKGLALWHAAKTNARNWFIALLIVNSAGVLDSAYLLAKRKDRTFIWPLIVSILLFGYLLYIAAQQLPPLY